MLPDGTALLVVGVSDYGPTQPVGPEDLASIPSGLGLRVGLAAGPQPDGTPFGATGSPPPRPGGTGWSS